MNFTEISFDQFDNVKIGQTENADAGTGVTVIVAPEGRPCGLDIRGGGPASRESGLMDPLAAAGNYSRSCIRWRLSFWT